MTPFKIEIAQEQEEWELRKDIISFIKDNFIKIFFVITVEKQI